LHNLPPVHASCFLTNIIEAGTGKAVFARQAIRSRFRGGFRFFVRCEFTRSFYGVKRIARGAQPLGMPGGSAKHGRRP